MPMEIKYSTLSKVPQVEKQTEEFWLHKKYAAEFILCPISSRTNSSEVTLFDSTYGATDSYFISYLPICKTILTGITDMLHAPNTVFKALHFPSFIFCTWHVKLLKEL